MAVISTSTTGGIMDLATVTLHIASLWPRPVTVVEADPDGGRLAARHDWDVHPGLVDLATMVRSPRATTSGPIMRKYTDNISVVVAPPAVEPIMASLPVLARHRSRIDEILGTDVLVVTGRLRPDSVANQLLEVVDRRILVTRTDLEDVVSLVHRADRMREIGDWHVLTAGGQYGAVDVARTIEWPVVADLLPDNPRGSARLRTSIREFLEAIGSDRSHAEAVA
jgi:hypothetical protein